jgi:hypothetical protein
MVEPTKSPFNVLAFVILLIVGVGFGGIIYLIYHALKSKSCPMCNSRNWGIRKEKVK